MQLVFRVVSELEWWWLWRRARKTAGMCAPIVQGIAVVYKTQGKQESVTICCTFKANSCVESLLTEHRRRQRFCWHVMISLFYFSKLRTMHDKPLSTFRIIAECLSARLLILQCMFSVGGVWLWLRHALGMQGMACAQTSVPLRNVIKISCWQQLVYTS